MPRPEQLVISNLGDCRFPSPLGLSTVHGDRVGNFVRDDARILDQIEIIAGQQIDSRVSYECAGPRQHLFFDPAKTTAAVVTCGGLCPGLNNVIRGIFYEMRANYGVPEVLGIRYGYQGLNPAVGEPPVVLEPHNVEEIHKIGGTVLGSSRGNQPPKVMVDYLIERGINVLFCVGGDGTQRGAHALAQEALRRKAPIAVVGIPKTIDNDIPFVDRSFGFDTAVEKSLGHIAGAHNEATGVRNGIGLVKLMGRHAGFIAAQATLASGQVNFTLIPEVPFQLEGEDGLLEKLHRRLKKRHHALVVVAEGAGQHLLSEHLVGCDASGNRRLGDIGVFLKERITAYLAERGIDTKIKYFDPSYHIRSVAANPADSLLCNRLARRAVHAAMAGKTDMIIGLRHDRFIHVPLPLVSQSEKCVDPESNLWMGVLASTAQEKW